MVAPCRCLVTATERLFHGAIAAILVATYAVSFAYAGWRSLPPTFSASDYGGSICLMRRMTGVPCPTCGMSRAFFAFSHGAWRKAVRYHPLSPAVYAALAVVMVRSAGIAILGRTWLDATARMLVWSLLPLGAAAVLIWAARLWLFIADGTASQAWRESLLGRLAALLL